MSFKSREIDVSFQIPKNENGDGEDKTFSYSGLRCEASINNIAGASLNSLQFRVFGMSQNVMNELSTLGMKITTTRKNIITVAASNDSGGKYQVFQGTISDAWIDYRGAPEISFNVVALAGYYEQIKAIAVNSFKGPTDVATIIGSLAKSMGFAFTDNGVTEKLESPYFAGSAISQMKDCARHAGISYDISNGSVQIWPSGGSRDSVSFLVAPGKGLVGYPIFSKTGIAIQTEFNPDILIGRRIEVQSSIPQACKKDWYCQVARHEISSQVPNGPWFTYAQLAGEGVHVITGAA
ncbi:hypothetical protein HX776_24455 [Pseudomonas agarici]|uniref:baseplate hub protein n=1 Tax=Pseudomonas agarici TaxID=46677 RepID=UPI0003661DA8|nr:hypothetical protein [Pseudomonas agarici]NWC11943.1 hypothetical protein [Pseudomonas agarici]SEL85742.1 hypothetical protein SAMN05216604_14030 [Pseudomonas agarici]